MDKVCRRTVPEPEDCKTNCKTTVLSFLSYSSEFMLDVEAAVEAVADLSFFNMAESRKETGDKHGYCV